MSKPSWETAPRWANWLAQDGDGFWNWYRSKPAWAKSNGEGGGYYAIDGMVQPAFLEQPGTLEPRPGKSSA